MVALTSVSDTVFLGLTNGKRLVSAGTPEDEDTCWLDDAAIDDTVGATTDEDDPAPVRRVFTAMLGSLPAKAASLMQEENRETVRIAMILLSMECSDSGLDTNNTKNCRCLSSSINYFKK